MPSPALLSPYSPLITPHTIRFHIDHLHSHGHVWWARFSSSRSPLTDPAARARWPHVADFADALAASGKPAVVFVTDHAALHAGKLTRIAFGNDPPGIRKQAPAYYANTVVAMWFRLEDIRALSYDNYTTAEWQRTHLGVVRAGSQWRSEPYARPYDAAAEGEHLFPIVVDAPTCAELFEVPPPGGAKLWADAPDAWSPRPVARAHEHLEKHWGPRAWKPLTSLAKFNFANTWVQRNHVDRDDDHDPSMGFSRIMTGVEDELHTLVSSLEALRDALPARGSPLRAALTEDLRAATPRADDGEPRHWTLGAYARLFGVAREALVAGDALVKRLPTRLRHARRSAAAGTTRTL